VLLILGTIIGLVLLGKVQMLGWAFSIFAGKAITRLGEIILNFIVMGKKLGWATALSMLFGVTLSWWAWIAIAALLAIIIALVWVSDSFTDACGNIIGSIFVVFQFIVNSVRLILNVLASMIAVSVGLFANLLIAINNTWYGAIASFWQFVRDCLDGTGRVAKAVSKIAELFGLDGASIDAKISTAKGNVAGYNDINAIAESGLSFFGEAFKPGWAGDAFDSGHALGSKGGQWLTDKALGLKDIISNKLNIGGLPADEIMPNIEDIKGNTGKIADSMELTEEDMKYLRDVANMEWKKEFTTANITVDMTNNNNVSNDFDLNSLAIGLRDLVEEEMFAVANGTYV
jgi:hypothetical protein